MNNKKRTILNMAASIVGLVTNLLISFWLSPYLIKHIGVEANGFVTLANNFVTYANIIVTALNSMAARFITISYAQKDVKKANLYYNSVFWGNLIIVAVLLLPSLVLTLWLQHFIQVPAEICLDVKILFSLIFLSFFLRTGFPNWDCGTYVSNRLERNYIPGIFTSLFRCGFLFLAFYIWEPKVYYVGIGALIYTILNLIVGGVNTHQLTPELRVVFDKGKILCSAEALKEMVASGIWNSFSSVGNILIDGCDLLVCNLFFGATTMGILSVSKTLPSCITQLALQIRWSFAPQLTLDYAAGDPDQTRKDVFFAMKMLCMIMTIPFAVIVVFGKDFYRLWVPTQDADLLYVLSLLACVGFFCCSGCQILFNVFTTVNKVKANSLVTFASGIISFLITLLLVSFTRFGVYAVAGVSTVVGVIRECVFTLPYGARYLGFRKTLFYPIMLMSMICCTVMIGIGMLIHLILPSGSWLLLVIGACMIGITGMFSNFLILFSKDEKKIFMTFVLSKLGKKSK